MLNSVKARPKISKVERQMNKQVFLVFLVQIIFCLFSSLASIVWLFEHENEIPYLKLEKEEFLVRYGSWMLLFT